MRPLKYSINLTLDGCYDHQVGIVNEELHTYATETLAQADALIFGRVVYGLMEGGWRSVAESGIKPDWMTEWMVPFARMIHGAKKYVVSNTLQKADWKNTEILRGADLVDTVKRLKAQPGKGLYVGGVQIPRKLAELGLIDEYEFIVHPRIVGHGPTLFSGLSKVVDLKLVGRKEFACGSMALKYVPQPAGSGQ